ncbi:MAG TPA: iron uptake system protein EfeO [Aeromicrobium sp.]|nr:iron uptake system protein EfeO [Aeromicrobium sp.]
MLTPTPLRPPLRTLIAVALGVALLTACSSETTPDVRTGPKPYTAAEQAQIKTATSDYTRFVHGELAGLVTQTEEFVDAIKAGDDDKARAIYPNARARWERVETIAAQFGDLDPAIDAREAGLAKGEEWTGWHRLEKDLWPARAQNYRALTDAERARLADKLLADTKTIVRQGRHLKLTATDIVEGSQGLLEEVAGGKVTGEEEYWSRTDLWDFQANLDGAWKGFDLLQPVIEGRDAKLAKKIDYQFGAVQGLLDATKKGDEFVTYDKLTRAQVKALSDAVNALGESLAQLSAVLP